jgi:hypothetical protein
MSPRIGGWMDGMEVEVEAWSLFNAFYLIFFIVKRVQYTGLMFCLTPLFNHV